MKFKVSKISAEPTKAGNLIVSLKAEEEVVAKTALGDKKSKPFYLIALQKDDVVVKEGDSIDLNMSLFNRVSRVSDINDEHGNPITFTWLHLN